MTDPIVPSGTGIEDALNAALAAASNNPQHPHRLERGECTIAVPLPPGVIEGLAELAVTVRLTGDVVSFIAPLAAITEEELPAEVGTALLRRQFYAQQTDGAGFAVSDREDVLVAQYHWIPIDLTADAFATIFGRFITAALRLRDEVVRMASFGAPLDVL